MSLVGATILSLVLLLFGLFLVLVKKNIIVILIGVELMFNAANVNFVAFNSIYTEYGVDGQMMTLFVIAIVAAEVALALAIILRAIKEFGSSSMDQFNSLKG